MTERNLYELDPLAYLIDSPDPWLQNQEGAAEGEIARARSARARARAATRARRTTMPPAGRVGGRLPGFDFTRGGKKDQPERKPKKRFPNFPWLRPPILVVDPRPPYAPPQPQPSPEPAEPVRGQPGQSTNGTPSSGSPAGDMPADSMQASEPDRSQPGSELVRWAQVTLNRLMGLNLPEDGVLDASTRAALSDFQRKNGLLDDGTLGPDTQQALTRARQSAGQPAAPVEQPGEGESFLSDLLYAPSAVYNKLRQGMEAQGVRQTIQTGNRDANSLTNMVFYARHPERAGQKLERSDPRFTELSREWIAIRDQLVLPTLKAPAPSPSWQPAPVTTPTGFRLVAVESPGGGRIQDKRAPSPQDLVTIKGVGGKSIQLQRYAAQAWQALVSAGRAAGLKDPLLLPTSGYRDPEHQKRLWEAALQKYGSPEEARKWVAPPGGSAHQSGRAIDFYLGGSNSSENVNQLRTLPAYQWLAANAQRFGFYPYSAEPWHWEYNPPAGSTQELFPRSYEREADFEDEGEHTAGDQESFLSLSSLPGRIAEVPDRMRELAALEQAIRGGQRDANTLTSSIFYARHPERNRRKLARGEPGYDQLSKEWLAIRDTLVLPALRRLVTGAKPGTQPQAGAQPGKQGGCQSSPAAWGNGVLAKMTYWWSDRNYIRSAKKVVENVPVGSSLRKMAPQIFPQVPPEAFAGFAANGGVTENTTECPSNAPKDATCRKQAFHEMGLFGIEGGLRGGPAPNPNPKADYNHWGKLAGHTLVVRLLGRPATMQPNAWKTQIADQVAVGLVNLLEASRAVANSSKLDPRIRPTQPGSLYFVACGFMAWSAGTGRAVAHLNKVADAIAAVPENRRWGAFLKAVAERGRSGTLKLNGLVKHGSPAFSALRTCQKLAAGKLLASKTGGNTAWFDTGLGSDEAAVLAAITELGNRACPNRK